jgi:hypothetical protein
MRDVIKQLKNNDEIGLTENELIGYRHNIHQFVITCARALVNLIRLSAAGLQDDVNDRYSYLRDYLTVPRSDTPLNDEVGRAIDFLWRDPSVIEASQFSADHDLKQSFA